MRASKSAHASSTSRGAVRSSANSGSTASSCCADERRVVGLGRLRDLAPPPRPARSRVAATPARIASSAASIARPLGVQRLARRHQDHLGIRRRAVVLDAELLRVQPARLQHHALGVPEGRHRVDALGQQPRDRVEADRDLLDLRVVAAVVGDDRLQERGIARQPRDADGLPGQVARAPARPAARSAPPAACRRARRRRRGRRPARARSRGRGCRARRGRPSRSRRA